MVEGDFEMGDPKAKVTVVEYASDTCPHCARFASEVFPAFKKAYVDTGKVLYVFREFPTDPVPLASAGFILARCSGREKYFDVVNALFQAQSTSATGLDFLMAGAKPAGLSEDQVKACLNEKPLVEAFNARLQKALDVAKINSTPTFVVNGRKLESGEKSLKDLSEAIDPLLGPQSRAGRRRHPA
jgi:protein-disulfide isomerase